MKVPFRLWRRTESAPADALLILSDEPADVLRVCARLGMGRLPAIHRVAGGFLVLRADAGSPRGLEDSPSGLAGVAAIRLRAVCPNFYIPVDAELSPALGTDEARALVRERGLVFLPGDRVLAFAPDQPVAAARLINGGEVRRRAWQALPAPRVRAERIRSIILELPNESPEAILEAGAGDIGTEAPRPADSGLGSQIFGQATLNAGKMLFHLGNFFGFKGLAGLGANWMKQAMTLAPRLSEGLLGKQEAALRELLRQFREGKLDDALRRALPLGDGTGRGGTTPYTGQELPRHSLLYSLSSLLGGSGGAPTPIWYGGADVQAELAREYRHAAEQAVRRGDYRRAAFIYGKLLADYRMAANVLMQGCLFHDAAMLYLTKLDDRRAAARAFESAGEVDRAVEIYRRLGEHVLAGDALRRAGEEELAFLEYHTAAEQMASAGNYQGAGELMAGKAERPDLARHYYGEGWQRRPYGGWLPCGLALVHMHADARAFEPLQTLVAEARTHFERPGDEASAERFCNELALLADRPALAEVREELRDQALLTLATKLQQRTQMEARPGNTVSVLMGRAGVWATAAVSDADHAFRAAFQQPVKETAPRPFVQVRLVVGARPVTAACYAPMTGDVFVGFAHGDVACFRPVSGEVFPVKEREGRFPVVSLAVSSHGEVVCVLQASEEHVRFRCYARVPDGTYRVFDHSDEVFTSDVAWLTPLLAEADYVVGLLAEEEFQVRHVVSLRRDRPNLHVPIEDLRVALLIPGLFPGSVQTALLLLQRGCLVCYPSVGTEDFYTVSLGWTPTIPPGSTLQTPPISWLAYGNDLELVGIDDGVLNWSRLHFSESRMEVVARSTATTNFTAATLVRPSLVAGVSSERIEWLRAGATQLTRQSVTPARLPDAVACFASATTGELLIVCQDGTLVRVPVPQG
jgi:hypothetical protein